MPRHDTPSSPTESRIEDYALLGDCETAALVRRDGSIDWLCWPRFDSDACFASLLGTEENGRWRLAASDPDARSTRRYQPGTLILETRYETSTGSALVLDFMPPRGTCSDVVRIVRGETGTVAMRSELLVRFGYGRVVPWVSRLDDGTLRAIAGPDMVVLRTPAPMEGHDKRTISAFTIAAGETVPFVLTYRASHEPLPDPIDPETALSETVSFWTDWAGRYRPAAPNADARLPPHWAEAVERSLITLKALTYAPTGGIVAAATTSLPEWIGGSRNWDYRFCWLRDSAVTLFAFMTGGYFDEAAAWRDWLVRAMAGSAEQMQIMYGLAGERRLEEWEAEWLPGFAGSAPVRIGNGASGQVQLDVYGEVMSLLHEARLGGIAESDQAWSMQRNMLERLGTIWREPDHGIWEVRGPARHFTFSKVMAWVAFDRCIESHERFGLEAPDIAGWRAVRDEIHADICRRGFDAGVGSFVQAYGATALDASLLLIPTLGFLPADDPRVRSTIEAIRRDLVVDGLVRRYHTSRVDDGLPAGEGAFLACSFWLASALVQIGELDAAETLLEELLALRNDVGLLAEEYDPKARRQLGNFPQAFSHVALVNLAHRLAAARAGTGPGPRPVERLSASAPQPG